MRIALLAMTEAAGVGQPFSRAFLCVAGVSVAQHQLSMALAYECQRVICIARGTTPELISLQHTAEAAGMKFTIATGASQLADLITANDELFVISEGLFADLAQAVSLLEGRSACVLVQPVEGALAAGFERIDINRASAGIMRIPGELVERLHQLPIDCDVISSLTRLALQSGIEMREVPVSARAGSAWRMIRTEAEALILEDEWLRTRFVEGTPQSPGRTIARVSVLNFGSSLLHAGNASNLVSVAVLLMAAMAVGLGWFGFVWIGFLFAGMGWLLIEASRLLRSAERYAMGKPTPAVPRADFLVWLIDFVIVGLILLGLPRFSTEPVLAWLCEPIILMATLLLLSRILEGRIADWASDRALLGIFLAITMLTGELLLAVRLLITALILTSLFVVPRRHL